MKKNAQLYTNLGKNISNIPWNVYPRPTMVRDSFFCLNGIWDFCFTSNIGQVPCYDTSILVPFSPGSLLSGIKEKIPDKSYLHYKKEFTLPKNFLKERVILHIGAADQITKVYLNGALIGEHIGGYHAFSFDITDKLKELNTLEICVFDDLESAVLPYGKQSNKRGGMWYTPVSGIWQTVWIESVPYEYITDVSYDVVDNRVEIRVDGVKNGLISLEIDNEVYNYTLIDSKVIFSIDKPIYWSPENPYLYYFTVKSEHDEVTSYFAIRKLDIIKIGEYYRLCLNGKPCFFNGVLDQGYFSDGLFLPATEQGYKDDILKMKELGFNMLRKHIKIEPEIFYYECDRLGMVVFQDMVNNGSYSFFKDTALPTLGFKKMNDTKNLPKKEIRTAFEESMRNTVSTLNKHPSVCYWTIFNEGWGQFQSDKMYKTLKGLDDTRFIDSTSGWFAQNLSDVDSCHTYFKKYKVSKSEKPVVLSEFGGYSYAVEGHRFNLKGNYGYGSFKTREDFVAALQKLYRDEILPAISKGLCAAVYTQLSDVEDETNGLITYDRLVDKVYSEELADIFRKMYCEDVYGD